jgi:hypothetical protein
MVLGLNRNNDTSLDAECLQWWHTVHLLSDTAVVHVKTVPGPFLLTWLVSRDLGEYMAHLSKHHSDQWLTAYCSSTPVIWFHWRCLRNFFASLMFTVNFIVYFTIVWSISLALAMWTYVSHANEAPLNWNWIKPRMICDGEFLINPLCGTGC